jgi:mono/diheme cytochrome c family protein
MKSLGLILKCGIASAALAICGSMAHAQSSADIARGEELALRECGGCHGLYGQRGVTIQGVVVPSFSDIVSRPGWTQQRVEAFVMTPHRPMPGMPLRPDEVRALAAYVMAQHSR